MPYRVAFLPTPRTGSRALVQALLHQPGAVESRYHHVHPAELASTIEQMTGSPELPMVSVARDPFHQTLSWYYHANRDVPKTEEGFADFIKSANFGWYFRDRLYPYHAVAPHVVMDEQDLGRTLIAICERYGIPLAPYKNYAMPKIGVSGVNKRLLTDRTRELVHERFGIDVAYYRSLVG